MSEAKTMAAKYRAEAKELLRQAGMAKTRIEKDELMERRDTVLQLAQSFDAMDVFKKAMTEAGIFKQ